MRAEVMAGSSMPQRQISQWGGVAFALGNVLFLVNKFNEMSRHFLGSWMPDMISGENPLLILLGQAVLLVGYLAYSRFYSVRVGRMGKIALRLLCGGGILVAIGHVNFISPSAISLPTALIPYLETLFLLVILGLVLLLIGLIWFGILTLRQPIVGRWPWLPLVTGLMGLIGFFVASGGGMTAIFLVFRTLFALGLIWLGVALWLEKPLPPVVS